MHYCWYHPRNFRKYWKNCKKHRSNFREIFADKEVSDNFEEIL